MSFARQAITGLMRAAGKGSWVTDRVARRCLSLRLLSLVGWWAGS